MKISIDNKGKKESFSMINAWEDVTVEKYARLVKYYKLSGSQRSINTISLFTDIPKKMIKQLDVISLGKILESIYNLQANYNEVYTHTFTHKGIQYGMIPDLSAITLGEYADIETFITRGEIVDNLCDIGAVLFRPIISSNDLGYTIEAYNLESAKARAKEFKDMSASQVQSAMVFFWSFASVLLTASGLSSEPVKTQEVKG